MVELGLLVVETETADAEQTNGTQPALWFSREIFIRLLFGEDRALLKSRLRTSGNMVSGTAVYISFTLRTQQAESPVKSHGSLWRMNCHVMYPGGDVRRTSCKTASFDLMYPYYTHISHVSPSMYTQ